MNKGVEYLLPLALLMSATAADATIRKCGVPVNTSEFVVLLDESEVGVFPMVHGAHGRPVVILPEGMDLDVPPEDVTGVHLLCREYFDQQTRSVSGRIAYQVYTRSGARKMQLALEAELKDLGMRQEAYRADRGGYAPSLRDLAEFDGKGYSYPPQMWASATGWSATASFERHPVRCMAAAGSASAVNNMEPGAVTCSGG